MSVFICPAHSTSQIVSDDDGLVPSDIAQVAYAWSCFAVGRWFPNVVVRSVSLRRQIEKTMKIPMA